MLLKLTNAGRRWNRDPDRTTEEQVHDPVFVVAAKIVDLRTNLMSGETLIVYDHGQNVLVKESQEEVARMLVKAMSTPILYSPTPGPDLDLSKARDGEHVTVDNTLGPVTRHKLTNAYVFFNGLIASLRGRREFADAVQQAHSALAQLESVIKPN